MSLVVHAARLRNWSVHGGFAGQTWIAMASFVFFMHETATRSPAYPHRYLTLFRRTKVASVCSGVVFTAMAFFVSLGLIASLFVR